MARTIGTGRNGKVGAVKGIFIRLTEEERAALERIAAEQNVSLEDLLVEIATEAVERRAGTRQ